MAYRKRTTFKRRSKRVYRRARKAVRKTRSRRSKRAVATRVFHVSETIDVSDIKLDIIPQNFISAAKITDFPRILKLREHFSEYRVRSFTTTYYPKQMPQFWSGPIASLMAMSEPLKAITYSDRANCTASGTAAGGVPTYNEAMNQPGSRIHSLLKPISRTCVGTIMQGQNSSELPYSKRSPWMRIYDSSGVLAPAASLAYTLGHGLYLPAMSVNPTAPNNVPAFTTVRTIRVSFRGRKMI